MSAADQYLRAQRSHDHRALIARWRKLARRAKLKVHEWTRRDGYPVFAVSNRAPVEGPSTAQAIERESHG